MVAAKIDKLTRRWIRNRSDEVAVQDGARFSAEAASFMIWWVERHCRLYEGTEGPLVMHSIADQPEWEISPKFDWGNADFRKLWERRIDWHLKLFEADEHMDWQFECHARIYGWQKFSPFHGRHVRRFRDSSIFIAKKNKKSPTMAANAMYLSVGDGEKGAKTFLLSKTGKQVRENACRHIFEMWKRSPLIHEESKFNQNDMRLYHLPTSSIIQPLSSDNKETRESNEGINGNTLVDEVHVVDEKTVAIVDRAGISRSEPIHMEFSTSGKNNAGYGRKRFDLAVSIQESREVDTTLFAYVAAAPQETKPEELRNEPHLIRLGKMANPAWGHTVNPAEFLTDYRRSARSPGKMRDFMMYRLNVWQQEGEPFIRMRDWDACAVPEMQFEDFHGEECQCGLDMAVSNDLLAFSWIFARDGKAHIFVDHWLPRVKGVEMNDIVPYLDWERQGWIRLLPGRVIDEDMVFDDIMARAEHVKIKSISFDPARSRYLTKKLDEMGYVLELFRQNNREFHPHVERLEKLIIGPDRETMEIEGIDPAEWEPELCHPANPCLDWQIKHCQVDEDKQRYKRPVKPASGEHKKIDGLVALVMGIRGLTDDLGALATQASAYADPNASWLKNLI